MVDEYRLRKIRAELDKIRVRERRIKILVLSLIAVLVISATVVSYFLFFSPQKFTAEMVYIDSQQDMEIQTKIKNATGYDWKALIENPEDNDSKKLAGMLFLANEINVAEQQFSYVNRSVGITGQDWSALGLEDLNASDTGKENVIKLIDNLEKIEKFYLDKGTDTQNRINRLDFLKGYVEKNGLPVGEIEIDKRSVIKDVTEISIENHRQLVIVIIVDYNLLKEM